MNEYQNYLDKYQNMEFFNSSLANDGMNILKALLLLVVAGVIAYFLGKFLKKLVEKMTFLQTWTEKIDTKISLGLLGEIVRWIVYFFIMVPALIGFFQILKLEAFRLPLAEFFNSVPSYFQAVAMVVLAWLLASLGKLLTQESLAKTVLDEKVGKDTSKTMGTAVYGFIILFFLPGILSAFGLNEILGPVQNMLETIIGFIPNILAAGLIFFIGLFVARLVQKVVSSILSATQIDTFSEKLGLKDTSFSEILGLLSYVFIIIPVSISALQKLEITSISEPATRMLETMMNIIPNILGAVLILTIAYIFGTFLSKIVKDLLDSSGVNELPKKLDMNVKTDISTIVSNILLVVVMFFSFLEAVNMLGFEYLSGLMTQFIEFSATILGGVVTICIGLFVANMVAKMMKASFNTATVPNFIRVVIIILAVAMGLKQMGIADEIINMAFGFTLGAIAVAAALAIGLGSRDVAGEEVKKFIENMKK